jgi:hypothetical protein
MKTAAERMRERLGKERVMTSISLRIPENVIEDLKEIAPSLGYSGYQGLIKGYISQGLRRDLERLEGSDVQALTESLRKQGVADEVIASAIADARILDGAFETELRRLADTKDRTSLCTFLESIPADRWRVTEGMAITSREGVDVIVRHASGGTGINTYETVAVCVKWSTGDVKSLGGFSSEELKLPNYISLRERQAVRERLTTSA